MLPSRPPDCKIENISSEWPSNPRWFHRFQKSDIVAMDAEKVDYPNPPGLKSKYHQRAAVVAIVNYQGNYLFNEKIEHKQGDFHVTWYSYLKNGLTTQSLNNGMKMNTAREKIWNILREKLVIVVDGAGDFKSLNLNCQDFQVWDTVNFFYRKYISDNGKVYTENLGLRSLCHHFFGVDMQPDGMHHEAGIDAQWTMKLFLDAYATYPGNEVEKSPDGTNDIPHYGKRQILYFPMLLQ